MLSKAFGLGLVRLVGYDCLKVSEMLMDVDL